MTTRAQKGTCQKGILGEELGMEKSLRHGRGEVWESFPALANRKRILSPICSPLILPNLFRRHFSHLLGMGKIIH